MAILKIARMGHPVLLQKARKIEDIAAPEVHRLLADMADTLEDAGGVGLAAPQVHESLRLFIYHIPASRGTNGEAVMLRAVLNPVVTGLDKPTSLGWEGCLSIPGLRAAVPRHERVRLQGFEADGTPIDEELTGFEARVTQHEADHLDGIMYPMRLKDFSYFGFNEETERFPLALPEPVL